MRWAALVVGDVAEVSDGGYRDDQRLVIEVMQHAVAPDMQASPKTMVLPVAVPGVARSGRSVVVGSGLGANLLVKFVDALYDVERIFEQSVMMRDRQFKFNHAGDHRVTTSYPTHHDQWQHWIETTVQQYEGMAA